MPPKCQYNEIRMRWYSSGLNDTLETWQLKATEKAGFFFLKSLKTLFGILE